MAILIRCPSCNKGFRVPDEREGESIDCSACGKSFVVRVAGDKSPPAVGAKVSGDRVFFSAHDAGAIGEVIPKR